MNEKLARNLGWLGLVSLVSYAAAVAFSPLAYPGYDWMAQAVSDLSADTAPSRVRSNPVQQGHPRRRAGRAGKGSCALSSFPIGKEG